MKYTEKDLYYKEDTKYIPYINIVMKDITIEKGVNIEVDDDGEIKLHKNRTWERLYNSFNEAISRTLSCGVERYKGFIKLDKKVEIIEQITYTLKKGDK